MSVPPVIFQVLKKGIHGSHGRSPINRSNAFRWFAGKSSWVILSRLEEREDLEMTNSKDETPKNKKQNCRYYALPPDIASFTDDQIEAWAEKLYDQMAHDLKLGDSGGKEASFQEREREKQ